MSRERYSLRLSKSRTDKVLRIWHDIVMEDSEEKSGKVSFLVKNALLSYIRTKEFVCIGRICVDSRDDSEMSKIVSLQLNLKDSPEILQWMEWIDTSPYKISNIVREILIKSIEIVDRPEDEWIPSYLDFDRNEELSIASDLAGFNRYMSQIEGDAMSRKVPERGRQAESGGADEMPGQAQTGIPPKSERKRPARCANLFGDDDW